MTLMDDMDMKCSVCGEISAHPVLLSTNSMGYQDLDTRPPSMKRDTMNTWVLECPNCGYVANDLEEEARISREFLKTDKYINCDGYDFKSNLSRIFYKNYLISKENCETIDSFFNVLHCAWACDDVQDPLAVDMRKKAIEIADELIEQDDDAKVTLIVMKSDFLRRAGEFDRLIEEYEDITLGEELLDSIIRFQLEKAHEKDDGCYTMKEVIGGQ